MVSSYYLWPTRLSKQKQQSGYHGKRALSLSEWMHTLILIAMFGSQNLKIANIRQFFLMFLKRGPCITCYHLDTCWKCRMLVFMLDILNQTMFCDNTQVSSVHVNIWEVLLLSSLHVLPCVCTFEYLFRVDFKQST